VIAHEIAVVVPSNVINRDINRVYITCLITRVIEQAKVVGFRTYMFQTQHAIDKLNKLFKIRYFCRCGLKAMFVFRLRFFVAIRGIGIACNFSMKK